MPRPTIRHRDSTLWNQRGTLAQLPASCPVVGGRYFAYDVGSEFIWDGAQWIEIGGGGGGGSLALAANQLQLSSSYSSSWQVNAIAPLALSTDDDAHEVIVFDDGIATGVGWVDLPRSASEEIRITIRPRGFTSSSSTTFSVYRRTLGDAWFLVGGGSSTPFTTGLWTKISIPLTLTGSVAIPSQFQLVRGSDGTFGGFELALIEYGR